MPENFANGRRPDEGFRHIALDDVLSTNLECLERARAGEPGRLWITAERQTGGRGRRGRSWISERGNLYASLMLIDPGPMSALSTLPLAISLALFDALRPVLPFDRDLSIKWPNDLLIDGKKVSGILLEGEVLPNGRYALVIGCGVNVAHFPDDVAYATTCLVKEGSYVTVPELFSRLYSSTENILNIWNSGRGIKQIVAMWRESAMGIGEKITVNLPTHSISGIFADIDENGMLLLDQGDGGLKTIAAGDVFFG